MRIISPFVGRIERRRARERLATGARPVTARLGLFTTLVVSTLLLVPSEAVGEALSLAAGVPAYGLATLVGLQLLSLCVLSGQWLLLLRRDLGVRRARPAGVGLRYIAASAVEALTPSAKLGGEGARLYLFARAYGCRSRDLLRSAARQVTGLLAGFAAFALVAAAFFVGSTGDPGMLVPAGVSAAFQAVSARHGGAFLAAGTVIAGVAVFFVFRLMVRRGLIRRPDRTLVQLAASSTVVWALYPVKVALAALFLGVEVSLPVVVVGTFAAYAVGLLPITPGGLGTYEATMIAVFSAAGVAPAQAAAVTVLARAISYWGPLLLSLGAAGVLTVGAGDRHAPIENEHPWYQGQTV